ncbi:MAG TPA: transposase [Dermatophilaceae bacterium]
MPTQVTAACLVAQDLMAAYAHPDLATGRAAAEKVITTAKTYPVPEIARLGRTLAVWRTEFLARFDHPDVSNGPTEKPQTQNQEHQTRRPGIPQPAQLRPATIAQLRPHQ